MKNIHPKWNSQAKVVCSCGNSFTTGSTLSQITVDICDKCHPFYTGEMKFVDVQGRVEKFQAKQAKAKEHQSKRKQASATKAKKQQESARSLKEVLTQMKKDLPTDTKASS